MRGESSCSQRGSRGSVVVQEFFPSSRHEQKQTSFEQYLLFSVCIRWSASTLRCFWSHRSCRQPPDLWVHGNEGRTENKEATTHVRSLDLVPYSGLPHYTLASSQFCLRARFIEHPAFSVDMCLSSLISIFARFNMFQFAFRLWRCAPNRLNLGLVDVVDALTCRILPAPDSTAIWMAGDNTSSRMRTSGPPRYKPVVIAGVLQISFTSILAFPRPAMSQYSLSTTDPLKKGAFVFTLQRIPERCSIEICDAGSREQSRKIRLPWKADNGARKQRLYDVGAAASLIFDAGSVDTTRKSSLANPGTLPLRKRTRNAGVDAKTPTEDQFGAAAAAVLGGVIFESPPVSRAGTADSVEMRAQLSGEYRMNSAHRSPQTAQTLLRSRRGWKIPSPLSASARAPPSGDAHCEKELPVMPTTPSALARVFGVFSKAMNR
ncbi:hypothetical protein LXA43DRAFT_55865 [Ganoderma leucocontextum]|nr:hypothetical protein LXA43DRAFT_55865 [Ganoderma leucocontextum]